MPNKQPSDAPTGREAPGPGSLRGAGWSPGLPRALSSGRSGASTEDNPM